MAASIVPASSQEVSLAPFLIFPILVAVLVTRRHHPRHQGLRGSRSYRESVPAPWNRPDDHVVETGSRRVAPMPPPPTWPAPAQDVRSPFDRPAFWDEETSPARTSPAGRSAVGDVAVPPAWDPLGVAPFAWDLPEPPPAALPRQRLRPAALARTAAGSALLVCAASVVGAVAGWWPTSTVIAASWAVVAMVVGLMIGAKLSKPSGR